MSFTEPQLPGERLSSAVVLSCCAPAVAAVLVGHPEVAARSRRPRRSRSRAKTGCGSSSLARGDGGLKVGSGARAIGVHAEAALAN
jgi:hypothetical protein